MAINLARLGRIQTPSEPEESVLSMITRQREEARKAKRDEQVAALNLAKLTEDAAERKRRAQEEADTNRVMGDYIQRKAVAGPLPQGVSGPVLPVEEVDKETALNLSRINPSTALAFQNERQGERDAAAKAAADEREAARKRDLEERRAHNDDLRTTAYLRRITGMGKPSGAGATGGARTPSGTGGAVRPGSVGATLKPEQAMKIKKANVGAINELDATADVIDKLIGNKDKKIAPHPGLYGLTGVSGRIPFDVKQPTVDAEALRQQLIAKSAFGELQKMRANSPTGGALGQVSDRENQMLQNAAAALQRGQSPEQFRKNLEAFRAQLRLSKQRIQEAYKQDFGQDLPNQAQAAPDVPMPPDDNNQLQVGQVVNGYRYLGGDPNDANSWGH